MKKRYSIKSKKSKNKDEKKFFSLYDLFYTNLTDFINEHNAKIISNPYKVIRNYMERNNIISSEKLLRPLINKCHIIKKNSNFLSNLLKIISYPKIPQLILDILILLC